MRRVFVAGLVIACVTAAPASATPRTAPAIDAGQMRALDEIGRLSVAGKAAPGVTIGVIRGGKIAYAKGFGYRNVENAVPAVAGTRYPIGSNTKQFTAAAILLLQDMHQLDINDRLSKYLPDVPHARRVTLRNLLTHAGGYAEFTALGDFDEIGNRPTTLARLVSRVDAQPLAFVPGTKREYSNTGYQLLTMVIERVSKMPYREFLRTHIFEPLGMTNTYVRYFDDTAPNVATEYDSFALGPWQHAQHIDYTWFVGAGAIITNVEDLTKWNAALDSGKLLSRRSQAEMLTPINLGSAFPGYAFGIMSTKLPNGHRMIAHGGNTTGAASQDARFPDDGLAVIVLSNSGAFDYNSAVSAIYNVFVPPVAAPAHKVAKPPQSSGPKAVPAQIIGAERWLDDAIAGHIDDRRLRPDFKALLQPQQRAALRALGRLGPRHYTLIDVDRRPPATSYLFTIGTPKKTLIYAFGRDDDGSVAAGEVVDTVNYPHIAPRPASGASVPAAH